MGTVHVVVGAQFGSEAKGHVAGWLSGHVTKDHVAGIRVGGPNAGHTVYGNCPPDCTLPGCGERGNYTDGAHPWRLRQVPVLAVTRPDAMLIIAQGSEVDMDVLTREVEDLDAAGYAVSGRLVVDETATLLTSEHRFREDSSDINKRLGSTAKGIGAARVDRIERKATLVPESAHQVPGIVADSTMFLKDWLSAGHDVIVEGTQGFGLGLHSGFYPFATSGDCRAIDFLAQTGLSPWATYVKSVEVWLTARTRPIRVAGNSGPLYKETSWQKLGLPDEYTTVTQRVRRVGEWDFNLVNRAISANGGAGPNLHLVLTMVDHDVPWLQGLGTEDIGGLDRWEILDQEMATYQKELDAPIEMIGTGPRSMIVLRRPESQPAEELSLPPIQYTDLGPVDASLREFAGVIESRVREIKGAFDEMISGSRSSELVQWWMDTAFREAQMMEKKAMEYGGEGAAIDLIDIGQDLADLMKLEGAGSAELTELGIYFYVRGKMGRWRAALLEGRKVSDDTVHDISVYTRMVQRVRAVGGWPYRA